MLQKDDVRHTDVVPPLDEGSTVNPQGAITTVTLLIIYPECTNYYVGTAESTFSFRIREDRQLMGFSRESTFNQLCGGQADNDPHSCGSPSYWKMPETVRTLLNSRTQHVNDEL